VLLEENSSVVDGNFERILSFIIPSILTNGAPVPWAWQQHNKAICEVVHQVIPTFLRFQKDGKKKLMKLQELTTMFMKKLEKGRG
jgi:hypothetical protein